MASDKRCPEPNTVYSPCGNKCEPSCANRYPLCPAVCYPPACICKKGYVRDNAKRCIPESACP